MLLRSLAMLLLVSVASILSDCGTGPLATVMPDALHTSISGKAMGGQQSIVGSHVHVLQAVDTGQAVVSGTTSMQA